MAATQGHCNGSPTSPPYATIYFAILESILLRSFMDSLAVLQLYRRYIDDVRHMALPNGRQPAPVGGFQKAMNNNEYKLHWEFTELSSQVDFMDMTITLTHDNKLVTTLYEKPTNLISTSHPTPSPTRPPVWSGYGNLFRTIHSALRRLTGSPGPSSSSRGSWPGLPSHHIRPLFEAAITRARAYTGPQPQQQEGTPWESSCCTWNTTPRIPHQRSSSKAGGIALPIPRT
ncbi:unknown protein [Seminavis robusta]|uniref:Uncharacterized protein n=1 Tax=Seminavis robusta TaxID=568900 RepID=A0A9N8ER06_9STRA|nr:unknown protein [Seminavis robusta]|eukprot:Sro1643_g288110.1 n/a (230) ;mRNA; f:5916-6605